MLCFIPSSEQPVLLPISQMRKLRLEAGGRSPRGPEAELGAQQTVSDALKSSRTPTKLASEGRKGIGECSGNATAGATTAQGGGPHFQQLPFFKPFYMCHLLFRTVLGSKG